MEKKYDYAASEKKNQNYWLANNIYTINEQTGPLYSIDTPPPTVSGSLHIGHIFSYTQTDVIARYKRMSGYTVFYPFGFDDNGLPTERYVEQKHNIKGYQLPRSEFIELCQKESALSAETFKQLWQQMGISAIWSHTYSTISKKTQKISQESFIELFKKGYIYRKNEPALYCATCCTSVSQAELEDKEIPSFFNDIIFKDVAGNDLTVGTTRPELLPSCVALLYNPEDSRYTHLAGQLATVPIFNYLVPIIADNLVEINKGTGLVMCCTFGDKKDIEWFKKHNLSYRQSIDKTGKWLPETGILAGMRVHSARTRIIEKLKKEHLLTQQKPITHAVNIHERCKKEIEIMLLSQWFVSILSFKSKFLESAHVINWYPPFMKSRYTNWVEHIGWDWCISRQRFYGIPFPAWHCIDCNAILLAEKNQLPLDPQEQKYPGSCSSCSSNNIAPDTDVMDTWNTSSLTPYICKELYEEISNHKQDSNGQKIDNKNNFLAHNFLPMSMRPQAHDIIRTWAFDTIVKTVMHDDLIPWHDIVISGHVLSSVKEKLSKSKSNATLSPESLLAQYPADAIRYWTLSGGLGQDTAFSEGQLKIGLRLITKLWNAFLFIKEHIEHDPEHDQKQNSFTKTPTQLGAINEWVLDTINATYTEYKKNQDNYAFSGALDRVENFFWHTFCDNFIELIKNQFYKPESYTQEEIYATRYTLYHVGLRILQLFAPFLPHITETLFMELYQKQIQSKSLHLTQLDRYQYETRYPESVSIVNQVLYVVAQIRILKTEKQLSLKTELAMLQIYGTNGEQLSKLRAYENIVKGITNAHTIEYKLISENHIHEDQAHDKQLHENSKKEIYSETSSCPTSETELISWHAKITLEATTTLDKK